MVSQFSEKHTVWRQHVPAKCHIKPPSSATLLESIHLYISKTARSKHICKQLRETTGQEIRVPENNSVIGRKWGRKLYLVMLWGKSLVLSSWEVTLAWTCCIVKRSMIRFPGHSQVRRWYGHVARMGQDRNVYNSHSETCGWKWRVVVVYRIGKTFQFHTTGKFFV